MPTLLERVTADLLRVGAYSEDHDDHRLAPEFRALGMRESPCTSTYCNAHDPEHTTAIEEAETRQYRGERHPHAFDMSQTMHGMEAKADVAHINHLAAHPEAVRGPATMMKRNGEYHVMDGHHRLSAALLRGDSHHPVNLFDFDNRD